MTFHQNETKACLGKLRMDAGGMAMQHMRRPNINNETPAQFMDVFTRVMPTIADGVRETYGEPPAHETLQPEEITNERLRGMSLQEVFDLLKGPTVELGPALSILGRLYDIALYDPHVTQQDRDKASGAANALVRDLEAGAANPQALAALQDFIKFRKETRPPWFN
jgi:hypothetical protein